MKVIFTCGGTAGHVNPALALAGYLREKDASTEILFVGAERGLERDLIAHTDYPFRTVNISSFHRSFRPAEIRHNLVSLKNLAHAERDANAILKDFRPDLIVGTGGYASYPLVRYGAKAGIPTAVHESNIVPGLTTRQLESHCERIMVGFEECRAHYKHPEKVVVTGTPVRLGFMRSDKSAARRALGIAEDEPLVVSVWGSLGATEMNKTVARMIALAMDGAERPFRLVHSAGKRGIKSMTEYMSEELGLSDWKEAGFDVVDYIYDMPLLMAAADIVLCRSGASTLAELTAIGKPAILVPSPNVVNNHQEKNARVLERGGGAVVLLESDAGADVMLSTINELLSDKEKLAEMEEHMRGLAVENATDEITSIVLSLASGE